MLNSTSITYQMKRGILFFSNKISRHLFKPGKNLPQICPMASLPQKAVSHTALNSYLAAVRKYIPQKRRTLRPSMMLLLQPWKKEPPCSARQPLLWTGVMMTIRCANSYTTINGHFT